MKQDLFAIENRVLKHQFQKLPPFLHFRTDEPAATMRPEQGHARELYRLADAALYQAKADGRNRVCVGRRQG